MLTINHHWPRAIVLLVLLLAANAHASSLCANGNENTAITATTPNTAFSDNGDGTVTHHTTGLIWQRCSLGQSWDGTDCTGSATGFSWGKALAAAVQNTFAGHSDWRLPNINELASIVEYRCWAPAINSQQFPHTPSARYWSSSPHAHHRLKRDMRLVFFDFGGVNSNFMYNYYHVRLVRDAQ
ncbi:TPA: DUF1566 domain-containing protein [Vibrio vulnificus]|nr:DUF1566 domain-containing protein [Vibrio vulnificus]